MNSNPDGDDYDNLLEMLFGTDPNTPDVPEIVLTKLNATQTSLEFPRALEFPSDAYQIEWSVNLVQWFGTGVTMAEIPGIVGFADVTATVTSPTPQPKLFIRIVVGR